jgi:uncharacterized protein YozE (UPF0346 family)
LYIDSEKSIELIKYDVHQVILKDFNFDKLNSQIKEISHLRRTQDITDNKYQDSIFPDTEEAFSLQSFITEKVSQYQKRKMKCDNIWAIVLEKNQSTSYHSHRRLNFDNPNNFVSIAFYTQVPEKSADLQFIVTAFNHLEYMVSVKPETGMLLMFNSLVPHMSTLHMGEEERIVIGANFSPDF